MEDNNGCGGVYKVVGILVWGLSFAGFWIYAISEYGFMLGVSLGWLPAAIAATVVAAVWPLIAIGVAGVGLLIWWQTQ